jgi:ABC-type transporter Mla MlaB component
MLHHMVCHSFRSQATLAAMIMMAVIKLIKFSDVKRLWRVDKRDLLSLSAAFLATLFLGVLPGIVSSMMFSLVVFIAFTTQPQVQELGRVPGTVIYRELGVVGVVRVPDVKIIRFLAPLFFANCSVLKDRLLRELVRRKQLPPRLQWHGLVLCFSSVSNIDSTSVQVLEEVISECHASKLPLLIAAPNLYVEAFLKSSGVTKKLGGDRFLCRRVHEAVRLLLLREVSVADLPEERKPPISAVVITVPEPPVHPVASGSNWLHERLVTLSRSIPLQAQELLRDVGAGTVIATAISESNNAEGQESKLDSVSYGPSHTSNIVFAQPKQQKSANVDRVSLLAE